MNFEDIKQKMDMQNMDDLVIPNRIKALKKTQLPIQKIRKNIKSELITQVSIILFLFAIPHFIEINPVAKGMYFILVFITSMITTTYLIRMNDFMKQTSKLSLSTKEVLLKTVFELRLTLEVYKTAIISGSLLLPVIAFLLIKGRKSVDESAFLAIITFDIPFEKIVLYIIGYVLIAVLIFIITGWWSDALYGTYAKDLKNTLEKMED
ncbi:hypothetical protein MQE36_09890 [Zhouia spongiae]|uniref:ABC transporter permease n=1 Tax=Zhouia spongiae TaxID=2202721 RepID=A0ABY3YIC4_9FLAO|nr:hypothetical protein [Zhouia spongiae]UNY97405.1 hypothetical protein MQE36_09890 [Zhouia spongiae]